MAAGALFHAWPPSLRGARAVATFPRDTAGRGGRRCLVEQEAYDGAGDTLRPERRSEHRVPGRRRARARPRLDSRQCLRSRDALGAAALRRVREEPDRVLAGADLRQARNRVVRFGSRRADARCAHGRRAGCDGRGRIGQGRLACELRRGAAGGSVRGHLSGAHDGARSGGPVRAGHVGADYPWAPTSERWRSTIQEVAENWGRDDFLERLAVEANPRATSDDAVRRWFVRHLRRSASPGSAVAFNRMVMEGDVRDILAAVRVPTLVLARPAALDEAGYVAGRIPGAQLLGLPGEDGVYWLDPDVVDTWVAETRRFLEHTPDEPPRDRVLATIVFTDLAGSTMRAAELGDRKWRALLERHHETVRRSLTIHRGREPGHRGRRFLRSFRIAN